MKVTIDDIVQKTGLSKSTVSRVLSGNGSASKRSRALVEQYAQELGYKNTRSGAFEKTIAIVEIDLSAEYSQKTHIRYIQTITRYFGELGYRVVTVDCCGDKRLLESNIKSLIASKVAGIFILSYIGNCDFGEDFRNARIPIVLVNHYPNTLYLDVVSIDNFHAGLLAGNYLLKKGHRKIDILSAGINSATSRNRIWGIKEAFRDNGFTFDDANIINTTSVSEDGYQYGLEWVAGKHDATAVFTVNSTLAQGIVEALRLHHRSVPEDLSILCADYLPTPSRSGLLLTTVCHDDVGIAKAAAELFMERLENPDGQRKNVVFSPIFAEGNSVRDITEK